MIFIISSLARLFSGVDQLISLSRKKVLCSRALADSSKCCSYGKYLFKFASGHLLCGAGHVARKEQNAPFFPIYHGPTDWTTFGRGVQFRCDS